MGEIPVGKSCWVVKRTRLNSPVPQQGAGLGTNTSLAQMVSGLVGQLLMQPVLVGESCSFLAQTRYFQLPLDKTVHAYIQSLGGWDWRITEFKDIDHRLNV